MIKAGPKLRAGFNEAPEAGIYCKQYSEVGDCGAGENWMREHEGR